MMRQHATENVKSNLFSVKTVFFLNSALPFPHYATLINVAVPSLCFIVSFFLMWSNLDASFCQGHEQTVPEI